MLHCSGELFPIYRHIYFSIGLLACCCGIYDNNPTTAILQTTAKNNVQSVTLGLVSNPVSFCCCGVGWELETKVGPASRSPANISSMRRSYAEQVSTHSASPNGKIPTGCCTAAFLSLCCVRQLFCVAHPEL